MLFDCDGFMTLCHSCCENFKLLVFVVLDQGTTMERGPKMNLCCDFRHLVKVNTR